MNNTKITLNGVSVLGVLTNVDNNNNVVSPDLKLPEFDFQTLYADEFWYCYPAVKSTNFITIQKILPCHLQAVFKQSSTHIALYQSVKLANLVSGIFQKK